MAGLDMLVQDVLAKLMRLPRWRTSVALLIASFSLAAVLVQSAMSVDSSTVVDCPSENRFVPAGSTCRWEPEGGYWVLVSPGPIPAPCERAEPPAEAIAVTCEVIDHIDPGSSADSALLSYQTTDGGPIRVFVFPSGLSMWMESDNRC